MTELTRDDVKILNENVPGMRGVVWHVQVAEEFYLISAVDLGIEVGFFDMVIGTGMRSSETMAFPADAKGEVADWLEEAMVPYKDHWACIDDLLLNLNGRAS